MSVESESSNRKSSGLGISILFEMNNELVIDNVDKMYSKLGPFQPAKAKPSSSLTHQAYIILEGGAYTGYTKDNNPEGQGCLLLNTGQIYEGSFKKGQIRGQGRMIDLDGTAYEGYWKKNDLKGEGKILWLDGKSYEGKIRKIKPHGLGTLHFKDSSYYTGRFARGAMHGNGVIVWANGRVYAGEWRKNDMNGFGAMHWADKYYFGSFKNGEISGIGKMQWNDGKAFLGEWTQGFRHGAGCMVEDGKFKQGLWEQDEFVLQENLKEARLDKMTEILEEKVRELKNDEVLEKFIEFSGIFTKGPEFESFAVLSELNESEMQVVVDDSANESIWSTPNKEEKLDSQSESDTAVVQINVPKLERLQSESVQSEVVGIRFHQPVLLLNGLESENEEQISLPGEICGPADLDPAETLSRDEDDQMKPNEEHHYSENSEVPEPLLLTKEIEDAELSRSEVPSESSQPFKIPEPYLRKDSFSEKSLGLQSMSESDFKAPLHINQPVLVKSSESQFESSGTSFSSDFKERVFHKPFMEIPDLSQSQSFRDSEDSLHLPKLQMIKEFTLEPSISAAPVLIHTPQVFMPEADLTLNISLEKIEEVNESLPNLDLDQSISTVFNEESELEFEVKEFHLPENVDLNNFIITKEKHEKKEEDEEKNNEKKLFDGRLEKVLVVNDKTKAPLMKAVRIQQNRPEGNLDFFLSPIRELLKVEEVRLLDYSEVPNFLQDVSLPLSEGFEILIEMKELLGPFDYFNVDSDPLPYGLVFVDWANDSGVLYCGQIDAQGNREGLGIEVMPTGIYEGYWKHNKRHGLGRLITTEGDNFEGFWRNDYQRGFGALWKYAGEGYVGDWNFNTPQGLGTEISALEIYEGSFHHGQRHGKGILTQANLKYTGEFFKGSLHGYGVIQWNNGNTYAGIFIHGESKGMKGAFVPAYKKTVYARRQIRKVDLKPIQKIKESEPEDDFDASESLSSENSDDDQKIVHLMDKHQLEDSKDSNGSKGSKALIASKISEKSIVSQNLNNSDKFLKTDYLLEPEAPKSNNSSIMSGQFGKPALNKNLLVKPEGKEARGGSISHSDNQNLNESHISDRKIQFPEANKGIMKGSSITKDPNLSESQDKIKFPEDVHDYSDDELHRRKAKFKSANKEKGVESMLKKDKKKS